jgi:hypothetical protein
MFELILLSTTVAFSVYSDDALKHGIPCNEPASIESCLARATINCQAFAEVRNMDKSLKASVEEHFDECWKGLLKEQRKRGVKQDKFSPMNARASCSGMLEPGAEERMALTRVTITTQLLGLCDDGVVRWVEKPRENTR